VSLISFFILTISFDCVLFCVSCLEVLLVAMATRYNHEDFEKGGMMF
jgi:hypothetical protein